MTPKMLVRTVLWMVFIFPWMMPMVGFVSIFVVLAYWLGTEERPFREAVTMTWYEFLWMVLPNKGSARSNRWFDIYYKLDKKYQYP